MMVRSFLWLSMAVALLTAACSDTDDTGAGGAGLAAIGGGGAGGAAGGGGEAGAGGVAGSSSGGAAPAPVPFVMGHRGGALEVPENTLAAFAHAIDHGINPEMDVRLSSDDFVVVIHDDTVDRTTDGSGAVASMTLQAIRQLDAGSHFDSQYAGEQVPTLDEALSLFASTAPAGMIASIDTKVENDTMYDGAIAALASHDLFERVFIEVTDADIAEGLRARPQGTQVRLATWQGDTAGLDAALAYAHFERLHCAQSLADRAADAHSAGKPLIPGLINDADDWAQVEDYAIDGINSNAPVFLKEQVLNLSP